MHSHTSHTHIISQNTLSGVKLPIDKHIYNICIITTQFTHLFHVTGNNSFFVLFKSDTFNCSTEPLSLEKSIDCVYNRAVLFDTTQNSWHGLPTPLTCPKGKYRKSIAMYYLTDSDNSEEVRKRALFAPRKEQENDPKVLELIKERTKCTK